MRRRLFTVIAFAVLAAFVSSTLLYKIISNNSPQPAKATTAQVVVAVRDLEAGALVSSADVRTAEWPIADASHWVARSSDVVGRAVLTTVAKDEPFAETRLAAKGAGAGLASRIPSGMRVVAVHVDELTGLSRFILAGMHVDVISTGAYGGQNNQSAIARTILQNVEVFSTGQTAADRDAKEKPATVPVFNLLVTPQQAEVLSQAVAQTRIELVLRNPLDTGLLSELVPDVHLPAIPFAKAATGGFKAFREEVRPAEEKKVAAVEPPPPPPPPPPVPTVEVIHGTKRTISAVAADPETGK
jgi:pilus assembly protein CpaB